MAQVLPDNGEILSLEIDPFVVDFALDIKVESAAFWKINHMVGAAWLSLQSLIDFMQESGGTWKPFDLAVIDADKAGMLEYFEILTEIPGLMSDGYLVCVDVTPFKGQLANSRSDKLDSWLISSGHSEIESMRKFVRSSGDYEFCEAGGLLQVRRKVSFTMANPFAAFPNCYSIDSSNARWAAPQVGDPVEELRKAVINADWTSFLEEGCTKVLASPTCSATWERCETLQALCASCDARNVLEVGSFCGVASLAIAESLPEDGRILSLELDPFLVEFGQDIKARSHSFHKVSHMVGPAKASLQSLVEQASTSEATWEPFDFVVIDADKASMMQYFDLIWDNTIMLTANATVCVDISPFKGQLFVKYVKGKLDDWIVKSGQESIDAFVSHAQNLRDVDMIERGGLLVLQRSGQEQL
jgi:predicted O-methyltransferase YrrM